MVLYYMVQSAADTWEFVYDLSAVGSNYQCQDPFVPI
jgi:hypothetical protein